MLLRSVLDLSPQDRERWIDASSAGDSKLRAQLAELIRQAQTGRVPAVRVDAPISASVQAETAGKLAGSLPSPGERLGRYEVIDLLGVGGMGSVYRALDASLGREVALKALGEAFRGDSASLRRFEREARVLATLNHPNIATIYGFERLNGAPFLVLERVEGDTLAQRLSRGRMPIPEALAIALQIVAGLEEAHAKGVIHRDLKPSNVMLTRDGRVKLVDFGLAKTMAPRASAHEAPEPITVVGIVLGTARYMSPEQVMGEDVDGRTDVWAFGCVLYEMLTGRPAFPGRSVSEAVAAVLRDDPDWRALPTEAPPGIVRLLRRCLRRNRQDRLQHIGDARLELVEVDVEGAASAGQGRLRRSAPVALMLTLALIAIAGATTVFLMRTPQSATAAPPTARLSLELPAGLTLTSEYSAPFAIAPAGSPLVLEANEGTQSRLYVRELSEPSLRSLVGTEGARQPVVSNDGAWVAFFANRKLWKIPTAGGPIVELADIGDNPRGAAWAPDGTIIVAPTQTSGLVRLLARDGKPEPLTTVDLSRGEYSHRWPAVLPGGKWAIFTVGFDDAMFDEGRIEAVSLETGERRVLVTGAGFARYEPVVSFCSFVAVSCTRSTSTPTVLAYEERLRSCLMAYATTHATAARISPCRIRACWFTARACHAPLSTTSPGSTPTASCGERSILHVGSEIQGRARMAREWRSSSALRRSPICGCWMPTAHCHGYRSMFLLIDRRGRTTAPRSPLERKKAASGAC